jgi:hypothetical protein
VQKSKTVLCGSSRIHGFFTWSDAYPSNFILFSTFLRKRRGKNRIYNMEKAFLMTPTGGKFATGVNACLQLCDY